MSRAEPAGADRDPQVEARRLFERAELHYRLGRFHKALDAYTRAYELAPLPGFLFNIGQSHRELGHFERAIFFYEGYLRELPDAENRMLVEELIAACREELEKRRNRSDPGETGGGASAALEEDTRVSHHAALPDPEAGGAGRPEEIRKEPTRFYQTWWFWSLVGGAALAIAGGTAYALAQDDGSGLPSGSLGTWDLRGL